MSYNRPITRALQKKFDKELSEAGSGANSVLTSRAIVAEERTVNSSVQSIQDNLSPHSSVGGNSPESKFFTPTSGGEYSFTLSPSPTQIFTVPPTRAVNPEPKMTTSTKIDLQIGSLRKNIGTFESGATNLKRFLEIADENYKLLSTPEDRVTFVRALRQLLIGHAYEIVPNTCECFTEFKTYLNNQFLN